MKPEKIDKHNRIENYAVAPYNFVSLHEKMYDRYDDFNEVPAHNSFKGPKGEELYTGYIDYTLNAETPIIISAGTIDGTANFFKDAKGDYAIPGNTIRGMVRSNAQILGFCSVKDDIQNSTFLYRDITGNNSLSRRYGKILGINSVMRIAKNVQAGVMHFDGKQYHITASESLVEGKNYFRVSEIWLKNNVGNRIPGLQYMYLTQPSTDEEFSKVSKEIEELKKGGEDNADRIEQLNQKKKNIYTRSTNPRYNPYQVKISFEFDNITKRVTKVGKRTEFSKEGYILSGGFIRGKMSHYIVPSESHEGSIPVKDKAITSYKDDLIRTKKMSKDGKMQAGKHFFGLPGINDKKPVFFVNVNEELHFGFTPYLRVSYSKSIHDGMPKCSDGISYTDALFGFINTAKSNYKSRVGFEDAIALQGAEVDKDSSITMLLGEPKATSYGIYLDQEDKNNKFELNVYEDDFRIRGIKQYWLKEKVEMPDLVNNRKMIFDIKPLKEKTRFYGRIRFSSLYKDELGLLLWAIKLNEGCFQNIGLAKPYGFGRVKVKALNLHLENLDKKYGEFTFDYFDKGNIDDFVTAYKDTISNNLLGGKSIDDEKPIKELMYIKTKVVKPNERMYYRYMRVEEYKIKIPLPAILDYHDVVTGIKSLNFGNSRPQNKHGRVDGPNRSVGSNSYGSGRAVGNNPYKSGRRDNQLYGTGRRDNQPYRGGRKNNQSDGNRVYTDRNAISNFNNPFASLRDQIEKKNKK